MEKFKNMTAPDIAMAFGVDVRTVYRWHDAGCPRKPNKRFILSEVIAWKVTREVESILMDRSAQDPEALERYRLLKGDQIELDLAQQRGTLVNKAEYDAQHFEAARQVRDTLLSLPARLAPVLAADQSAHSVGQLLFDEMVIALHKLSGSEPEPRPPGWKPYHNHTRYQEYLKDRAAGRDLKMYQDFIEEDAK